MQQGFAAADRALPAGSDVEYDPTFPVPVDAGKPLMFRSELRVLQRTRRAEILAAIRRLLIEHGCEATTMRGIAEASGYAVQTIYNLVGPRDIAISEAISDYSLYVGRMASLARDDPLAFPAIIDSWVAVTRISPEFSRQCNMIFFTPSREIYYRFRERQLRGMKTLLNYQQKSGIIRKDVCIGPLAEQLGFFSASMWVEWSDHPFELDELRRKLAGGFYNLLSDKFAPEFGERTNEALRRLWH